MVNLELILSMLGTILGLIITVCTFIVKTVRNAKAKRIAEQVIEISNAVLPFIKEAEKFSSYTGEEKKAYVMTKANQFALEHNIPFMESQVSEKVEELVTLTKQVNVRMRSKEKTETEKFINESEQSVGNVTSETSDKQPVEVNETKGLVSSDAEQSVANTTVVKSWL